MDFNVFFDALGIKAPDRCFDGVFKEAVAEYRSNGVYFLDDAYIGHVNSFEGCLSNCLEETKSAAAKLRKDETLAVYALFLHRAMEQRTAFLKHINTFEFPGGEEEERRLLPFIVLLPELPKLFERLKAREVPEDIIAASLRQFEDCVFLTQERTGRLGFLKRYFDHMQLYLDEKVLNIGRLRFEMVPALESNILVLRN